ncbi:hypothetical protein MIND_01081800 [Mycena indigotica]|uniref:Secreted protein n=1 Tax=Mycena indigotica TaxID=2126181 RepID=A0A8H6SBS2_9AGAR|nr:uncharacterized protein MIND_01081800 [Mycena indigotica]KAF7295422.1 hypothetical protein MIND_01081800 [Mycena indigotica]
MKSSPSSTWLFSLVLCCVDRCRHDNESGLNDGLLESNWSKGRKWECESSVPPALLVERVTLSGCISPKRAAWPLLPLIFMQVPGADGKTSPTSTPSRQVRLIQFSPSSLLTYSTPSRQLLLRLSE